jgi:hypothetical protein
MDSGARVCPHCGEPPGGGMFCEACGRNLSAVERLPTRAEWDAEAHAIEPDAGSLADRCAQATAAFLAAMHAAGDPGLTKTPMVKRKTFQRTEHAHGWVVRPVDRDDDVSPRRYEPGLVLTVEGRFHRLDSELRGWGQRNFPYYHHTVPPDPIEMPVEARLIAELHEVARAHGVEP